MDAVSMPSLLHISADIIFVNRDLSARGTPGQFALGMTFMHCCIEKQPIGRTRFRGERRNVFTSGAIQVRFEGEWVLRQIMYGLMCVVVRKAFRPASM